MEKTEPESIQFFGILILPPRLSFKFAAHIAMTYTLSHKPVPRHAGMLSAYPRIPSASTWRMICLSVPYLTKGYKFT